MLKILMRRSNMKTLIIALLIFIPAVSNANEYYDSWLNNLTDVKDSFDLADFNDESGVSKYKMEIERVKGADLYDRISGAYITTTGVCRTNSKINKAVLVKGRHHLQLFFENGRACGVEDVFFK